MYFNSDHDVEMSKIPGLIWALKNTFSQFLTVIFKFLNKVTVSQPAALASV